MQLSRVVATTHDSPAHAVPIRSTDGERLGPLAVLMGLHKRRFAQRELAMANSGVGITVREAHPWSEEGCVDQHVVR